MKLTMDEVACCLNIPATTLQRWVRQGRIPIIKGEGGPLFDSAVLEKWSTNHNLPFTPPHIANEKKCVQSCHIENLLPAMERCGVLHHIAGADQKSVLRNAVNAFSFLNENIKIVLTEKLIERENMASTGVGKGVAIPHPREPMPTINDMPMIATCFLEKPIDYVAIDDKPVFVLFILLSPTVKLHLHLLSRLAYCLRDNSFVNFLKERPPAESLFNRISTFETNFDSA